jgi:hypothetical protein
MKKSETVLVLVFALLLFAAFLLIVRNVAPPAPAQELLYLIGR